MSRYFLIQCQVIRLLLWVALVAGVGDLAAGQTTGLLEIQSLTVDGKTLPGRPSGTMWLQPFPGNVGFTFGAVTNAGRAPVRLRYMLEGYDSAWREGGGEMYLTIRFFDDSGDQIGQTIFQASGESTGWSGALTNSTFTHRRETLTVPPQAARVWVVISSAGPPATVGIYVVDGLVLSKLTASNGLSEVLIRSPFGRGQREADANFIPRGWMRDGIRPSMAKLVELGTDATVKAFAVLDDDSHGHAEWHTIKEFAAHVSPGDQLEVEWNELFSMGVGNVSAAHYEKLPPGNFRFRVLEVSALGTPTGEEASVLVRVPLPFWRSPWFWGTVATIVIAAALAGGRYFAWHRMRREMVRLNQQRLLEQERVRIAQDIHDDLGARVTQISLLSAMAQDNQSFPQQARGDFDRISKMSRELVSALYETVWAVNPENDNLDALGNYLCQMVNQLCEQAQLRCRLHVLDLPLDIQVSSHTRHNISMAVKEAVHNVIKHAHASEVTVRIAIAERWLAVSIQDDGCGFQLMDSSAGNGLTNMKRRLKDIGGTCEIESAPGRGTTVHMRLAGIAPQ